MKNNLKKYLLDMVVAEVTRLGDNYVLLAMTTANGEPLPSMVPGQFVEIQAPSASGALLRRPISINDVVGNRLLLLIRNAGRVTGALMHARPGDKLNMLLPLGNGWSIDKPGKSPLLVGGGVGVAPLLYLGRMLKERGVAPTFLLGARSEGDLLMLSEFEATGCVITTTEDGSHGVKGFVTNHPEILNGEWSQIYCCGPEPMMRAVANVARQRNLTCEVSLENMMACGLGACLCCVQNTTEGHLCVCTDGPIFNINQLLW